MYGMVQLFLRELTRVLDNPWLCSAIKCDSVHLVNMAEKWQGGVQVVVVCPEGSEELVMGRLQAAVPDMPIYTPGTTTLKADRAMRETTLLPDDRQRKYRDNSIPGSMLRLIGELD